MAVTDHYTVAFVRKNVARIYMTLWRHNDVQKLTLTPFCFEKSSVRKGIFNVYVMLSAGFMQVKYAELTTTHVCFIALTLAGSLGRCLNKQLPRDPANVNT